MRLIIYSDLHLEFEKDFQIPTPEPDDILILAGDITTFDRGLDNLKNIFDKWPNQILYVAGNHEYYSIDKSMQSLKEKFIKFIEEYPQVSFLDDKFLFASPRQESTSIAFVFGGTMWTDFDDADPIAMIKAQGRMNDYNYIWNNDRKIMPLDTISFHNEFKEMIIDYFDCRDTEDISIVISHHAPIKTPNNQFSDSPLNPAYESLDMMPIIERYQPDLWIYGHTHVSDDTTIGKTRIVSNPRGYQFDLNKKFDPKGLRIEFKKDVSSTS